MNITSFSPQSHKGLAFAFLSCMNGGKSEYLVLCLKRAPFARMNCVAYNHSTNHRDEGIAVNGVTVHPAVAVGGVDELVEDLKWRRSELAKFVGLHGRKRIKLRGITHIQGLPLDVIGIDEANLFALTGGEASKLVGLIEYCREENMVLYAAGLSEDFRGMEFGQMDSVLRRGGVIRYQVNPMCMAVSSQGRECDRSARHSQRLWSRRFAAEMGLEGHLGQDFGYETKDLVYVPQGKLAAPFFDKTIRIEGNGGVQDGDIVYVPVCSHCFEKPFEEETMAAYQALVSGGKIEDVVSDPAIAAKIEDFFLNDVSPWVVREDSGLLVPAPYFRNAVGGYSRQVDL